MVGASAADRRSPATRSQQLRHPLRQTSHPTDPGHVSGERYPYPRTWLAYTGAESWQKTGPVEQFYDAADAGGLVHRFGMAESLYSQDTIERQRRGRDAADPSDRRCLGGYIVWKFNDSWPQIYSGKADYFLEPYHAYYAIRRAYRPVLLSSDIGTYIHVWVLNDSRETVRGTLKVQLFHPGTNQVRKQIERPVIVAPGKPVAAVRLDEAGIGAFRRDHILFASLAGADGKVIARADTLVDIERHVAFPPAQLAMRAKGDTLEITTDRFAGTVTLEGDAAGDPFGWFFEDNYFDLAPGEVKQVKILGHHTEGRITAKPWYSPESASVTWRC